MPQRSGGHTLGIIEKVRGYHSRAIELEPEHEVDLPAYRRRGYRLMSMSSFALLDLNDTLIGRYAPDSPPIWDTDTWPWIAGVAARTPEIQAELVRYLDANGIPHVAEISGLEPDSPEGRASVPLRVGAWRSLLLFVNGEWVPETARHFPVTRACLEDLSPKANVGFSALEPHSHIHTHVGPNRGGLRFQLPIIVPGEPGDCRIRIGDDMVVWSEGEPVVFDLSVNHEAWNDTDHLRVLLMVELCQPLPLGLDQVNRLTQYLYRWYPSFRQMPARVTRLSKGDPAAAGAA